MVERAFLDVKVSRLKFPTLHGKTDGTAVGLNEVSLKGTLASLQNHQK